MQQALYSKGPLAIAVDASGLAFQFYESGVYYNPKCNENDLDHAMTAVGYGVDSSSGEKYWIVKNQWGTGWGEDGYIRMIRDGGNTVMALITGTIYTHYRDSDYRDRTSSKGGTL